MPTIRTPLCEHRQVLVLRGGVDAQADAVVVEELLDHEQAADQVAGLRGDDGDRGQERVAQHVPADTVAVGRPLR